jgi:GNAT superfamily N-acetyltransferase
MTPITIIPLQPEHFEPLEQLQRACYPTLAAEELMRAEHFTSHYAVFPEGQFVALAGPRVVGQASGFFTDFDFDYPQHTFRDFCAGLHFTNHDPAGAYYYGADISVHPEFRGQRIGRLLYDARKELVRRDKKRGIVGGGLIPGYAIYKHQLTPHEYVSRVAADELNDATLTFQLRMGFVVRDLLQDYIEDSASNNWSTLIEWVNRDLDAPA